MTRSVAALCGALAAALLAPALASADPAGRSTLEETIRRGAEPGFGSLRSGPGERYTVRENLAHAGRGRAHRRRSLVFFGQLADAQLLDEMSPGRVELTDPAGGDLAGTSRPQEALGPFVFDQTVRNMRLNRPSAVRQSDGRRARLRFALATGDQADNMQTNEARWFAAVLDGARVDPFSGQPITSLTSQCPQASRFGRISPADLPALNARVAARVYTGVQDYGLYPGAPNRFAGFWDPDTPVTDGPYRAFPRFPGLMDRAQRAFTAGGLDLPWYAMRGNHDALIQGAAPAGFSGLREFAVDCFKVLPAAGFDPRTLRGLDFNQAFARISQDDVFAEVVGNAPAVPPDADRQMLSKVAYKAVLGRADARHGFGFVSGAQNRASRGNASYYAFDRGPFRFVVLDTSAEGGADAGNIDDPQWRWLAGELDRSSSLRYSADGRLVRDGDRDRLIVLATHHTIATLNNPRPDELAGICADPLQVGCDSDPRRSTPIHDGAELSKLALAHPNVIALVNGHVHHTLVTPRRRSSGAPARTGFWEITTASHIDWPQQSRTLEVMDNRDGTLSLFGTILDQASPVRTPQPGRDAAAFSNAELASLSRLLAANDPQRRAVTEGDGGAGRRVDRNVELLVRDPRRLARSRGFTGTAPSGAAHP